MRRFTSTLTGTLTGARIRAGGRAARRRFGLAALAALFAAAAAAAVLASPGRALADGHGGIAGELPRSGIALVSWSGGTVGEVADAVADGGGCALASLWANGGDGIVGYRYGADAAANAAFLAAYEGGALPSGSVLLLVCAEVTKAQPAAYTKAFVQAAIDRYERDGLEATLAYYNSPESIDGQWYVYVAGADDAILAHAPNPEFVGENLADPEFTTDPTGYYQGGPLALAAEAGRWATYVFANPESGENETKHSWAVRRDGLLFGSGWYETGEVTPRQPDLYARDLVRQALERYGRDGREATLAYYNSPESADGQWYVFVADEDNAIVAHAPTPANVGRDLASFVDADGYAFGEALAAAGEDGAWVSYDFLNPGSGRQQRKHTWAVRRDGLLFGSGWYEAPASKAEPDAYTQAFVQQAIARYWRDGLEATLDYYNSPESIDGPWYVFIADGHDTLIAHAAIPENVGEILTDRALATDDTGYYFGSDLARATETGRWVTYDFVNPETGRTETKHAWAVRRDGLLFGSGWYEAAPTPEQPAAYAKTLVREAVARHRADGREAAIGYYNSPESVDGPWYVFVADEDGVLVAHAPTPANVGRSLADPEFATDAAGYFFGEAMTSAPAHGRWVTYVYLNPDSGEQERKHAWVVRSGGLLFGSGWYERP